jgi:hypothetical protein
MFRTYRIEYMIVYASTPLPPFPFCSSNFSYPLSTPTLQIPVLSLLYFSIFSWDIFPDWVTTMREIFRLGRHVRPKNLPLVLTSMTRLSDQDTQ